MLERDVMTMNNVLKIFLALKLALPKLKNSQKILCARSPEDKASASEAEDRWFDSSRAYHKKYRKTTLFI
jgi:hypothetical protein